MFCSLKLLNIIYSFHICRDITPSPVQCEPKCTAFVSTGIICTNTLNTMCYINTIKESPHHLEQLQSKY